VAVAYRGLSLDGFAFSTTDAYSALVGLVLAYGAFEQYAVGLGHKKQAARTKWFGDFLPADADASIRSHDPDGCIFNLISSKVEGPVFDEVQRFRDRKDYCPSVLAAAVRHVFVHGILAATSNGAKPSNVASLCRNLSELLLGGLAEDFQTRVRRWQSLP